VLKNSAYYAQSYARRSGSRVWKGEEVHFVEKVEDQKKKKKGEPGWVKEAAISL